jgi:hypothetical protein
MTTNPIRESAARSVSRGVASRGFVPIPSRQCEMEWNGLERGVITTAILRKIILMEKVIA